MSSTLNISSTLNMSSTLNISSKINLNRQTAALWRCGLIHTCFRASYMVEKHHADMMRLLAMRLALFNAF